MIYFEKVCKIYPPHNYVCLEELNLTINKNDFVSIVGPSGAGKTTIVKMLIAEEKPTYGKIFYNSVDIHSLKGKELEKYRQNLGVVFQDYKLIPTRNVFENISLVMEATGRSNEEINTDIPYLLKLVKLQNKEHLFPYQLSGGEQQRLSIARALANQPEIIIADEPTGNLDPINTAEIMEILRKINELGITVILTTHSKDVINQVKSRLLVLEYGRIIKDSKDYKG